MQAPDLLTLLKNMLRVRRMEEVCAELYTQEKIRGFLHLYIGEEAVVTGVMNFVRPQDNVMATYREHGHALLKGVPARAIMAEMYGKAQGCSHGRGGSMHLISLEHRFFGGNAIVAAGIPQATGLALAGKRLNENRRTVCFFGEGAMAEGAFHETMNMAALWEIPTLFCCENNLYAMGTALHRSQSQLDLVKKAQAYNIPALSVDGMNVFDVLEKTQTALRYMEKESCPFFLEFKTYRFRPHSMFDPELYRSREEVNKWKERCPIEHLKKITFEQKILTAEQLKKIESEVESEIQDAVLFAENAPWEPVVDLEKHLYGDQQEGH